MKKIRFLLLPAVAALLVAGCSSPNSHSNALPAAAVEVNLPRLGAHHFEVTTRSPEAQRAFDRGLTLAYSFGHYAAEQEFRRAAALDPDLAMAWWGVALVNGPHVNFPLVPPQKAVVAWDAVQKAKSLAPRASALEQALIDALGKRYAQPQPEDRSSLDQAYADAMREVWKQNPRSADIAALFAESVMDMHPWNYWQKDGQPQPWTVEIVTPLETALRLNPRHPGANHYYIHAMEASPHAAKAVAAADRLGPLVPDSGHMVHMPSHIYARVGQWEKAAESNRRAMQADQRYRAAYPRPGFYGLYMIHNAHFLSFVAMMQGDSAEAIQCARQAVAGIPQDFREEYPGIVDGFLAIVPETLMRFGRWEDILAEPEPENGMPLSRALWRYTRVAALTSLDRLDEARKEQADFEQRAADLPPASMMGNNHGSNLLKIASHVLKGEIAAKTGQYDEAITQLRAAAEIEDTLVYDEPPGWIQPTRHTLGAVLLKAGKPAEAEVVYQEELLRNPENGWSLMGLRDSLRRQDKFAEAEAADARWKKAWASADVTPPSTCYCQRLE
jgi:tetratricopeptide (TPR) repeat protein